MAAALALEMAAALGVKGAAAAQNQGQVSAGPPTENQGQESSGDWWSLCGTGHLFVHLDVFILQ